MSLQRTVPDGRDHGKPVDGRATVEGRRSRTDVDVDVVLVVGVPFVRTIEVKGLDDDGPSLLVYNGHGFVHQYTVTAMATDYVSHATLASHGPLTMTLDEEADPPPGGNDDNNDPLRDMVLETDVLAGRRRRERHHHDPAVKRITWREQLRDPTYQFLQLVSGYTNEPLEAYVHDDEHAMAHLNHIRTHRGWEALARRPLARLDRA